MKYSKKTLSTLEDILSESEFSLRYEKGNFQSGYCIVKEHKVIIINKYFPVDGKINALLEIIKNIEIEFKLLSKKNQEFYLDIIQ
ncbi:MAG: hypothetical protein QM536_02495 [Chitinophagaceae bacterium]|nr:hypothetical protein [Chitinophagaceae bacterium]